MAAFRILHTADSHIGADLPVRANGRYRRRGSDFVDSFKKVVARAYEFDVDLVIHAGDLFDRSQPGDGAIAAATEPLWQLARAGIQVIIVPGNHERSALPGALLLSHPNIHILRAPRTVVISRRSLRVAVAGFPCLRRTEAQRFADAVRETGWISAAADVTVLAVHQTFEDARCGPANFRFRAGEDVVPRSDIPAGFDYIAAGHIHRHQVLNVPAEPGPPLVYAGSPDRIAFAEIGEPKGAVLVEFSARRAQARFLEHGVRSMHVLPFDVSGLSGADVTARLHAAVSSLPAEAVVQVRLSGQATRRALAGLKLTQGLRAARPDVLAAVSSGAVEWIPERTAMRLTSRLQRSAFEVLDAPPSAVLAATRDELSSLPDVLGTYALYDAEDRLLYIGKARHARTRVRTHLRAASAGNHFHGWTHAVARVELRVAASELEALLVEAELIRRLGPPFNRQMRLWQRYCYLCATGQPHGQLTIAPEPGGRFAFGPLRSRAGAAAVLDALCRYFALALCPEDEPHGYRALPSVSPGLLCARYFAGACSGPCGGRGDEAEYQARVQARAALLAGEQTEDVQRIRVELERMTESEVLPTSAAQMERAQMLHTLSDLCETARTLRAARELLNVPLLLPGEADRRVVALVTAQGLSIETIVPNAPEIERVRVWSQRRVTRPRKPDNLALPKPVADVLCALVRVRRCQPDACEFLSMLSIGQPVATFSSLRPASVVCASTAAPLRSPT